MSELRIALVAEGPTDRMVIEAALKAILGRPFILTVLQPEPTRPQVGGGWCGVFKWCRAFSARAQTSLETDPTLPGFDLFVIHVDADVADKSYADGGGRMVQDSLDLPTLPCALPCPPPGDTTDQLRIRMVAWLGLLALGPRTVLCVPSKAIDAWLAAAVFDQAHQLQRGLECNPNLAAQLASLPKLQRIGKRDYQLRAGEVIRGWVGVTERCTQAARFARDVRTAVAPAGPA